MLNLITVAEVRGAALQALNDYEDVRADFDTARSEHGTCFPATQFEVARILGELGEKVDGLLGQLDDLGDHDGFHAAFESAAALEALIAADAAAGRPYMAAGGLILDDSYRTPVAGS